MLARCRASDVQESSQERSARAASDQGPPPVAPLSASPALAAKLRHSAHSEGHGQRWRASIAATPRDAVGLSGLGSPRAGVQRWRQAIAVPSRAIAGAGLGRQEAWLVAGVAGGAAMEASHRCPIARDRRSYAGAGLGRQEAWLVAGVAGAAQQEEQREHPRSATDQGSLPRGWAA
jgi:hypothetical protein